MTQRERFLSVILVCAGTGILSTRATAAVLTPGMGLVVSPDQIAPQGVVIDTLTLPFSYKGDMINSPVYPQAQGLHDPYELTGTFEQAVLRAADGTLIFRYTFNYQTRVVADPTLADAGSVRDLVLTGFAPQTSTNYHSVSSSNFLGIGRDLDVEGVRGVAFNESVAFSNAGLALHTLYVETNAQFYDEGGEAWMSVYTPGGIERLEAPSFRPLAEAPIPEPASLALVPLAVGALALRLKRRKHGEG